MVGKRKLVFFILIGVILFLLFLFGLLAVTEKKEFTGVFVEIQDKFYDSHC